MLTEIANLTQLFTVTDFPFLMREFSSVQERLGGYLFKFLLMQLGYAAICAYSVIELVFLC